jgi:hypothetical protein
MCEGIMKIFVETGPGFDDCAAYRRIEVDLKGPGKMSTIHESCNDLADLNCQGIAGSPLDLEKCRIEITADVGDGRAEKITLLDLIHALNGKLKVLYERRYARDFQDVHWFLAEDPEQIRKHADELDEDGLRTFIDSLPNEKSAFWNSFFDLSDLESEHGSDHVEGSSR